MSPTLCTKNPVTRQAIGSVKMPEATRSYAPVGNAQLINLIEERFCDCLAPQGMSVTAERFGLSASDQRMFGVLEFGRTDKQDGDFSLAVGVRNSYDKTVAAGIAVGGSVFVCDNLMFDSDGVVLLRRHTRFVWRDIEEMIAKAALQAWDKYQILHDHVGDLQGVGITDDRAYEMFGLLYGRGVINGSQIRRARECWQKPPHAEFRGHDLWAWYNSVNEALKSAPAHIQIDAHSDLHELAMLQVPERFSMAVPEAK